MLPEGNEVLGLPGGRDGDIFFDAEFPIEKLDGQEGQI